MHLISCLPLVSTVASALACALTAACGDQPAPTDVGALAPASAASAVTRAARAARAAGRPTEVDPTPFEIPAGVLCDFAFRVEPEGRAKAIELPGERMIFLSPGLTWTITNLDNLKQETFRIPGAFHVDTLGNGDVVTVVTGRNILGDPVAGLVLALGRFSFVFDATGTLIQPLQGTGRLIDICELLT
jgi:hypothetical protein